MATINNLVIVESPAKAKTIEKFLGKDFKVMSSRGHIRDLSKKEVKIEEGKDFEPEYEISPDKTEIVASLKKAANQAKMVWLASDEDREGEAIAWHLYEVLGLKPENTRRIVFHEITKPAILSAIEHPRSIDLNLVDAQQARRLLDRIVGFELSPVLWKKIKPSLSAGRVQSVAVRLIVERENEIRNFKQEPYFRVTARFLTPDNQVVKAEFSRRLETEAEARKLLADCAEATFTVGDVTVRPVKKSPAPPFTTSTLQQEAARKLGFTVSQTMMVAQHLYEAGHITYMRTDSLNLSNLALSAIASEVKSVMGPDYLKVRNYHTKSKGAQEAHEAIRPTYVDKHDIDGTQQEKRLYQLIWRRTVASQMADAELEKTTVEIAVSGHSEHFTAQGEVVRFDGFLKVYSEGTDDSVADMPEGILPSVKSGRLLGLDEMNAAERFTQHPPRYTEASLVKKMEELGIGRPSTYAPTISTIQQRDYVTKTNLEGEKKQFTTLTLRKGGDVESSVTLSTVGADKGKLIPTDIGVVVNDFLTANFPNVLDYNFTADLEERFDLVAEGQAKWKKEIGEFYDVFHPEVTRANDMRLEHKVGERMLGTDPQSGKPVSVKIGRFGPVVQIGDSADDEKPRFAPLRKDQSVFDITLEEALKLFELPRALGEFEDADVSVAVGRFGPYIKHAGKFVSLPKDLSPMEVTLDRAIDLIKAKREADSKKIVKTFSDDPELQILNGRYGVYISYKKSNYKIPKTVSDPASLTLQQCMDIVRDQDAKPKRTVTRRKAKK
ncbi:MAG: type I DNA topoisomerase [Firmicutes bacterium]|nr:type I DNA topoisomerase [Bacillota bacterium]MCM1400780.1 type I DNA topoisomerase [Bacteroides sp.]MCM1477856.1 type I DNA topoisomerase [Bacteroides sp.]